jgi:thioredoxin
MIVLTKENWNTEVTESNQPVVVDFYGVHCGPCRAMAPTLERLSAARKDIKFCKIDVAEEPDIFAEHGVNRIPTFILFKEGKEVDRQGGTWSEREMNEWITAKGINE